MHDYAKVEPEILFAILNRNVSDLEVFIERIKTLLLEERSQGKRDF